MYKLIIKSIYYFNLIPKVGVWNIAFILWYRFSLKIGIRKYYFPQSHFEGDGIIFYGTSSPSIKIDKQNNLVDAGENIVNGQFQLYGYHWLEVGSPPDWQKDYFSNKSIKNGKLHWTELSDFNPSIDIKNVWELSRFGWVLVLSAAYSMTNNYYYIDYLNKSLFDWVRKNPVNIGPNWKCGQEASIRVINVLIAGHILNRNQNPTNNNLMFVESHIKRIKANNLYSIAQDNNHGISVAAGLYLGALFLLSTGAAKYHWAKKYMLYGKNLLENRVSKLVASDGGFSQDSTTYHRMVLEILSIVELFRDVFDDVPFGDSFYIQVKAAVVWLSEFIDETSGDTPNIGANDGTHLFNFGIYSYRDFCPSITLAARTFGVSMSKEISSDHILCDIFSVDPAKTVEKPAESVFLSESGFCKLVGPHSHMFLRLPKYRYRPSHADALHFDLWYKGNNIIRDTGSYSYAIGDKVQSNFYGTRGHSTVEFDNRDQMPKISRFMFGQWLEANEIDFDKIGRKVMASYIDYRRCYHKRSVERLDNGWLIIDEVNGAFDIAHIRWVLSPDKWCLERQKVYNSIAEIIVKSDNSIMIDLGKTMESKYYMDKSPVPVLNVTTNQPGKISTKINFS